MAASAPRVVEFQTTSNCNASCVICPSPQVRQEFGVREMAKAVWSRLGEDLKDLQPKVLIPYLNNEPLTDPSFECKLEELRTLCPASWIEVSTNGVLLNDTRAHRLLSTGIDELLISIFGFDEESHKRIMGLSYKRVVSNIDLLLEIKKSAGANTKIRIVKVDIPTVMSSDFIGDIDRWKSKGLDVSVYGFLDRAGNVRSNGTVYRQRNIHAVPRGCELNRHRERMYVLADGTVIFCCHDWRIKEPMGNILQHSLGQIWRSQSYETIRKKIEGLYPSNHDFLCRQCKLCLT